MVIPIPIPMESCLHCHRPIIVFQPPDKQLAVIGAFVVPTVVILRNITRPVEEVMKAAEKFYRYVPCVNVTMSIWLFINFYKCMIIH